MLVCSLLATCFNSFLVVLEDSTVITLVEELPDGEETPTIKEIQKEPKTINLFGFGIEGISIAKSTIQFLNTTQYNSVYLRSVTPPPELV